MRDKRKLVFSIKLVFYKNKSRIFDFLSNKLLLTSCVETRDSAELGCCRSRIYKMTGRIPFITAEVNVRDDLLYTLDHW